MAERAELLCPIMVAREEPGMTNPERRGLEAAEGRRPPHRKSRVDRHGDRNAAIIAAWRARPVRSLNEIGEAHGLTKERVRQILILHGIDPGSRPRFRPGSDRRLENMAQVVEAATGCGIGETATALGLPVSMVRQIAREAGVRFVHVKRIRAAPKDALAAEMYRAGVPVVDIARAIGSPHKTGVHLRLRRAGVETRRRPAPRSTVHEGVRATLGAEPLTIGEITRRTNAKYRSVYRALSRLERQGAAVRVDRWRWRAAAAEEEECGDG